MTLPPSFMEDNGRTRDEEARGAKEIAGSGASSCQAVKLCVSRQEQTASWPDAVGERGGRGKK